MHPSSQRRVHGAEFKARVLAECQQPGASVAAVALAHGLNVNLVRKWLIGRGLKRTGLVAPRGVVRSTPVPTPAPLQFVPVDLPEARRPEAAVTEPASGSHIHVELRRGATALAVRWPASQAASCATWLRELAAATLEG